MRAKEPPFAVVQLIKVPMNFLNISIKVHKGKLKKHKYQVGFAAQKMS